MPEGMKTGKRWMFGKATLSKKRQQVVENPLCFTEDRGTVEATNLGWDLSTWWHGFFLAVQVQIEAQRRKNIVPWKAEYHYFGM